MTSGLAKRGVEVEIVKWADHLLTGRIARAKLGNTEAIRDINNGCAEGGVLSPHFFNSVVSEAIDLVNEDPDTYGFGFADDIKIL